ncbi:MAG: ATP-dependent protease LonB [Nanoarchaeota archaeon]
MAKKGKKASEKATSARKKASAYTPFDYATTKDLPVPKEIIDQVIGQDEAVEVIKKAAQQRRHVFLIGEPGTGKSMLGIAMSELLPKEKLTDIISFQNPNDENQPLIRVVPAGKGRQLVAKSRVESQSSQRSQTLILIIVLIIISLVPYWAWSIGKLPDVVYAASLVTSMLFFIGFIIMLNMSKRMNTGSKVSVPKVIVDNFGKKHAPFNDATGAHAGALLGDVLHDPFQSGGLGTPAHERIVAGMIHKSHMGVLFIDEISTLDVASQQELLTALQEGKFAITGQSERSAGAMVRTEPVPCNFVLIAAGNYDSLNKMHPALRSRIRGYGYEIYMKDTFKDTPENHDKIAVFIAQEVKKDKKIPHFDKSGVESMIEEARRRANRKGHLTLRLRELGGLIRAAGDIALERKAEAVTAEDVENAKALARPIEQQISDTIIERKKEYEVIVTEGQRIGRVNGLAVMGGGSAYSGIVLPIESQVSKGNKETEIVATGKLGDIAKEAITNVSAVVRKMFGQDIKNNTISIQFLQTYEGVEGDSASIAVAVSVISALKDIPIRQDTAMTGSLSVRGNVLPIGGVSYKIEAAIEAGLNQVIVPQSNLRDIVVNKEKLKKIKIIAVRSIHEVLEYALDWKGHKQLLQKVKKARL